MTTESRRISKSLPRLLKDEEAAKKEVTDIFTNAVTESQAQDVCYIRDRIAKLKLVVSNFENISVELFNHHMKNGSLEEARTCRRERLKLIHQDSADEVKVLNALLSNLGQETASSISRLTRLSNASAFVAERAGVSEPRIESPVNVEPPLDQQEDDSFTEAMSQVLSERSARNECPPNRTDAEGPCLEALPHHPKRPEMSSEEKVNAFLSECNFPRAAHFERDFNPQSEQIELLDPTSRRQLKQEILRGSGEPFGGNPEHFWEWRNQLERRIAEAQLGPLDTLYVLQANTIGEPKRLVTGNIAAFCRNPQAGLSTTWKTLQQRYGNDIMVAQSLLKKLRDFPLIKNASQINEINRFYDLCTILQANLAHCNELGVLNLSQGMRSIWQKMPDNFQNQWQNRYASHLRRFGSSPDFHALVSFLEEYVEKVNIPAFHADVLSPAARPNNTGVRQTRTLFTSSDTTCIYHNKPGHTIHNCTAFKKLQYEDRKSFATDKKLCYSCLGNHFASSCPRSITCSTCQRKHATIMHRDYKEFKKNILATKVPERNHDGNDRLVRTKAALTCANEDEEQTVEATVNCADVCGPSHKPKICSKILLVDVKVPNSSSTLRCWCIVDEQSNTTFCDPKVVEFFGMDSKEQAYSLTTMNGVRSKIHGERIEGLQVKGARMSTWINLPPTLTNPNIPTSKEEAADPLTVSKHTHIMKYAKNFPEKDKEAEVLLLIGADCGEAMYSQSYGPHYPYVQRTKLGWALTGPVCRNTTGTKIRPAKTLRTSTFPCEHYTAFPVFNQTTPESKGLFRERDDDDLPGLSQNDEKFVALVSSQTRRNEKGNLEIPLPFKDSITVPNNKLAVFGRTSNTLNRLKRDEDKLQACLKVMQKYLSHDHIEEIPRKEINVATGSSCYINVFPVTHKKKGKLRIVFDSSAAFDGVSLNDVLLQGPDEANKIIGVLMRFRQGKVAFSCDIDSMFHGFHVPVNQRDYLRFFWWSNNDPSKQIVPFRAKVHVFGNSSSPAIATFGLRYTTLDPEAVDSPKACNFIKNNFYVDDGLGSADSENEAIDTLKQSVTILSKYNLRLHKIVSNSRQLLKSFPRSELATDGSSIELVEKDVQPTLGLKWEISSDKFVLTFHIPNKCFTKRGVLSTVNSIYDPLGFVAPIVLAGRLLQREMIPPKKSDSRMHNYDWDDALPEEYRSSWIRWISAVSNAQQLSLPRCFIPRDFPLVIRRDLHVYSDASDHAIGCVAYLRSTAEDNLIHVAFVSASSKVSPRAATSIPRLELCAAAEAARLTRHILQEMSQPIDSVTFYTDSYVVLGYLKNQDKRFSRYVTTRIRWTLNSFSPKQWHYVSTRTNPADIATRPHSPEELKRTAWFDGPDQLRLKTENPSTQTLPLVDLPEAIKSYKVLSARSSNDESLALAISRRTKSWVKAKAVLRSVRKCYNIWLHKTREKTALQPEQNKVPKDLDNILIRDAQREIYRETYKALERGRPLSESDPLLPLSPFLDGNIIRVGGRLRHSIMPFSVKHPTLLPTQHQITDMILLHFHEKARHQGRHITLSSLRQGGFHIHRGRRALDKLLSSCITCRALRGPTLTQKMADLPPSRLEEHPPFTNTGVDIFGPYMVHDGASTRRTNATKKVWAAIFTCLTTRAVHIEPVPAMDTSSFILALRRFTSLRGQCKLLQSDQGSNFIGAKNELKTNIDFNKIVAHVKETGIDWNLNTPAASHCGGVWERKIKDIKSILNTSLFELRNHNLSRDELYTLFQEAVKIVNDTPLFEISADPNDPFPITPNTLLTLKWNSDIPFKEGLDRSELLQFGKSRWRRIQYLKDFFFSKWRTHYLQSLQSRRKWKSPARNVQIGDIVLVRDSSLRRHWPIARVIDVKPSPDGLVRSVQIQTTTGGRLRRAIQDLVLLQASDETQDD